MEAYTAKGFLRNPNINTILSSSVLRKLKFDHREKQFLTTSEHRIIDASHGIRLSAQFTLQESRDAPVVIMLHGWLGCAESRYLVALGSHLYENGFDVVRLNFRDHGFSEHLNRELFHSCRIQEAIDACASIQAALNHKPVSIVGFSLGGNFALRINARTNKETLNIHRTVSFCPVMNPDNTLTALEKSSPIYSRYFIKLWKSSFKRKIRAFPKKYSKTLLREFSSLRSATEHLAVHYAGFDSLQSYLDGYAITGDKLANLQAPAKVVLAKDDPIIPWQDHEHLHPSENLDQLLCTYGGHCGFLAPNLRSPWVNEFTFSALSS